MSLTLDRQNAYRARYARLRPGWQPATAVYEATIRVALEGRERPVVLDVGCGRGGVLEQLANLDGPRPLGIDPDFASLAGHRLPDLRRAVATAEAIPLPGAAVDVVIAAWVLEHLPAPERAFAEAARVLRPGGVFICLAPNRHSPIALLNRALLPLQRWLVPRLYGRAEADTFPVVYRANTRRQVAALARAAGLRLAAFHAIDDPTYLAFNDALFWLSRQAARLLPEAAAIHFVAVCAKDA